MNKIRLLQDILSINVKERPGKTALICDNQRVTYAQLEEMSDRLANALRDKGIGEGDRVLFYLLNSVELVVSILATLKAGAVFVGMDYSNTYDTLHYIASDCEATAVITYANRVDLMIRLLEEVPSMKISIIVGSKEEIQQPGFFPYEELQSEYPADPISTQRIEGDLAYLIYTSGSTGQSKGVMVTHRCILFTIYSGIEFFQLSEHDVHVSPLQLSFSPGINQLFQTLLVGGTLILEKSLVFPVTVLKRMESEHATGFAGVPTILTLLMQNDMSRFDLSSLRYITSVGAALPLSLIQSIRQKLPQTSIYSYYGMAEASYSLVLDPERIDEIPSSVGKPFPGTQAWIIDEKGRRLGTESVGELILRGTHVRSGYWNKEKDTALRFRPGLLPGETVCYTGDIFRTDAEGNFFFVSRSDEIIKSGAKKVAPREIENTLYNHNGVLEAAAVGIPDPLLGQAIKAFVVPTEQARATLTAEELLVYCKQKLEAYKVPCEIEIRENLPKTSSGKIKKTGLA